MDQNTRMLRSIYKSAELGRDILSKMIRMCDDLEYRNIMAEIFSEYHRILCECERLLLNCGLLAKSAGRLEKIPIFSAVTLNAKIDSTSSHFSEMLMQGSLMSYIDIARELRECPDAAEETKNLAWRLMATEENNMQKLKQYI